MENTKPMNTDYTDGQLAILNELLDFIETNPTAQEIRNNFISPKCKYILAQIEIEKENLNSYGTAFDEKFTHDGKSLFETLGDMCRPENINHK